MPANTRENSFSAILSSADATTGAPLVVNRQGDLAAYTVLATDTVCVTDVRVITGASVGVCEVYIGDALTSAAGEHVLKASLLAAETVVVPLNTPFFGVAGSIPHLICSIIGQVDVQINGFIISSV